MSSLRILFAGKPQRNRAAGYFFIFVEHVWDINGTIDEKGLWGGLLKGLFGYNGNPSLIEIVVYPLCLAIAPAFFLKPARSKVVARLHRNR